MSPLTKISIALLGAASFALPAAAATEEPQYHTSAVYFGDLNLATEAGQARLERRINLAAREVCKTVGRLKEQQCRADARNGTAQSVNIALSRATGQNLAVRESRIPAIVGN